MKEKTFSPEDNQVVFSGLLALRDKLEAHEHNVKFGWAINAIDRCIRMGTDPKELDPFKKEHKLTACNQQRYWWNRYQYHTALALIEDHFLEPNVTKVEEQRTLAKEARANFDALGEQAQAEDDARCAEAESREVERFEQYYR